MLLDFYRVSGFRAEDNGVTLVQVHVHVAQLKDILESYVVECSMESFKYTDFGS